MAKLADDLAALVTMSPTQLRGEWERAHKAPAPLLSPDLLRRSISYRLQEKRHGGIPALVARELARVAAGEQPAVRSPPVELRPGTQLVREWQGKTVAVLVTEDGFVWEGRRYASLSSIAKAVTGAHWSGPRFFGITAHA